MKKKILVLFFCALCYAVISYAQIPEINQAVVDYVNTVIGKKVGRGECWDLAKEALNNANARWNHKLIFGRKITPGKDSIYPGDIIQFEKVVIKYKKDNGDYTENYPHHTAIVYKVLSKNEFEIAHQNTSTGGKKVIISTINLSFKKSGKIKFYRPEPKP